MNFHSFSFIFATKCDVKLFSFIIRFNNTQNTFEYHLSIFPTNINTITKHSVIIKKKTFFPTVLFIRNVWLAHLFLLLYKCIDHDFFVFNFFFTDYVYFETSSTSPFQIRRIEELNKTPSGNVEAKVMCFYRRRDLPNPLVQLADKHQSK